MLRRYIAAIAAIFLLLTGCTKDEPVKEHKLKKVENTQKEKAVFPNYYPLTGIGTQQEVTDRPVAVVVNNHPKARPQSGLEQADLVYEVLAEGNVTRLLAIFQSEHPERIGPVRSARSYYIELAKGYNSMFVAHGYSPEAKEMLQNGYIDNINGIQYDGTLFKRSSDRVAPHNSYISYENILKGAKQRDYPMKMVTEPLKFLTEKEQASLTGTNVKKVSVTYLNSSIFTATYEWDETLGKYKRYSNGVQTVSADTGKPVLLDNVFIVEAAHQTIDNAGRRNINLNSGGNAYLLQKGLMMEVAWVNQNDRILPVKNDSFVGFVPGKTWINIVPTNPGLANVVHFDTN